MITVKRMNEIGDEVEKSMMEFDLTSEELELVETTIVEMKLKIWEELNKRK